MNTRRWSAEIQPIRSRWLREVKALIDASAYTEALAPARDYVRRKPTIPRGTSCLARCTSNWAITPRQSRNLSLEPPGRPTILKLAISSGWFWRAWESPIRPCPSCGKLSR